MVSLFSLLPTPAMEKFAKATLCLFVPFRDEEEFTNDSEFHVKNYHVPSQSRLWPRNRGSPNRELITTKR
jgi:hypothetical protein